MKKLATAVAPIALIATPAFAADGDEFIQERVKLIRSLADKADPFIKPRLIKLAERYEHELCVRSRSVSTHTVGPSPSVLQQSNPR